MCWNLIPLLTKVVGKLIIMTFVIAFSTPSSGDSNNCVIKTVDYTTLTFVYPCDSRFMLVVYYFKVKKTEKSIHFENTSVWYTAACNYEKTLWYLSSSLLLIFSLFTIQNPPRFKRKFPFMSTGLKCLIKG